MTPKLWWVLYYVPDPYNLVLQTQMNEMQKLVH